jgi:hypothetical protein
VRTELHQVQQQDQANTQEVERALREAREATLITNHSNSAILEARLKALEATASKFASELTAANRKLTDALDDIKVAARQIVGVQISRAAEELREQIAAVCLKFVELTGAAELNLGNTQPLLLDSATAELLATQTIVPKDDPAARRTPTESRTRRWRELWQRLVNGEVDAS